MVRTAVRRQCHHGSIILTRRGRETEGAEDFPVGTKPRRTFSQNSEPAWWKDGRGMIGDVDEIGCVAIAWTDTEVRLCRAINQYQEQQVRFSINVEGDREETAPFQS
jgi:hypothetical protein